MNWETFRQDVVNFFTGNIWAIIGFIAALVLGILVIKIVMRILRRIFLRSRMEKIAQNFLLTIIRFLLLLVFVIALLSLLGVEVGGLVTAISAAVLAIGMALESNIANVANGIVIISSKMFRKGDFISVDGVDGSVDEINFLFTTLITPDNKRVTIPNSTIVGSSVVNFGSNKTRRVDFTFCVAYESDVELVKKVVLAVMESDGRVLLDPKPFCSLKTLGESSLDFFANCWCDNCDYWGVYFYIVENVYNEFKRNGISVPYRQIEVRNRTDEVKLPLIDRPLPERVEKIREVEKPAFDFEKDNLGEYLNERMMEKRKKRKEKRELKQTAEKKEE